MLPLSPVEDIPHDVVKANFWFTLEFSSISKEPRLEGHGTGEEGEDGTSRHPLGPVRSGKYDGPGRPNDILSFKSVGP